MGQVIQNVVVVMLENRSYDNVLGWLWGASNVNAPAGQSTLNGLTGTETNPNPNGGTITIQQASPNTVGGSGQTFPATCVPIIDPRELFGDMAQQYLDVPSDTENPYGEYTPASGVMTGYVDNYNGAGGMSSTNLGDVMTYLTPQQLPVTAYLAQNFGVCDQWFASVPSQTFVNRIFALCAAPQITIEPQYSVVNDLDHLVDPFNPYEPFELNVLNTESLPSQLENAGQSWKLYFHDYSIAFQTIPYIANNPQNVSTFDNSDWGDTTPAQLPSPPASTFVDDVQNHALPAFSFIEPRYQFNFHDVQSQLPPSSSHPGSIDYPPSISPPNPSNPPIDATGGELLLMQVYNLLRNSNYWNQTLLIITYDEAGGVYDHVAPTVATPPGTVYIDPGDGTPPTKSQAVPPAKATTSDDSAANGFGYTVFGGRVPAIIVSPYVAQASTIRAASGASFDHTSIIQTVYEIFGIAGAKNALSSLTSRDANAPSLVPFIGSAANNNPLAFSGTIVASPSQLIFNGAASFTLLASAGPCLSLTASTSQDWIVVTPLSTSSTPSSSSFAPGVSGWAVSIDTNNAPASFAQGQITITCCASIAPVSVTVAYYPS